MTGLERERIIVSARITDFSIEVPAKWVLAGEHSVLRGRDAIAFPHPEFTLRLSYQDQDGLKITPTPFQSQIRSLIEKASAYLGVPDSGSPTGEVEIESGIPIGAGFGSSAALCAAIARFVIWKTSADSSHWVRLATHLEDTFHGKSSGMDVSVIAEGRPIRFSMEKGSIPLTGMDRMPRFEFYDSGFRGNTRDCIERVRHWQRQNPHLKEVYDDQMQSAADLSESGLRVFQLDSKAGEQRIKEAMELASTCFETWGLLTPELLAQKYDLLKQGALAVKLTGAGLGGFWVALWPSAAQGLDKGARGAII